MKTYFPVFVLTALQVALFVSTEARLGSNEWILAENQDASIAGQERNIQHDARPFSNLNSLDESGKYIRVMVGFRNENGRIAANGVTKKKWIREMKHSKVATMMISTESIESLRSHPHIE
jgi:hypothetical protein